jgi:dTDP-4-amino-4,6-dideoxygalactose transaminase
VFSAADGEGFMAFKYQASRPYLTGNEEAYVRESIATGWISWQGPYVARFEQQFASFNGVARGVACSSGTAALILALC